MLRISNGSNLHSNASNPFRMVRICISNASNTNALNLSNGSNLNLNALNPFSNVSNLNFNASNPFEWFEFAFEFRIRIPFEWFEFEFEMLRIPFEMVRICI